MSTSETAKSDPHGKPTDLRNVDLRHNLLTAVSEEDLALKQQLELYVERAQDPSPQLQKAALENMRQEIRTSTSSMTSVPKPLKFLRPHYPTLKALYDTMPPDSDEKILLADILSILALTMSAEGEQMQCEDATPALSTFFTARQSAFPDLSLDMPVENATETSISKKTRRNTVPVHISNTMFKNQSSKERLKMNTIPEAITDAQEHEPSGTMEINYVHEVQVFKHQVRKLLLHVVNSGTKEEFVGKRRAIQIIEDREKKPFREIEELKNVGLSAIMITKLIKGFASDLYS